MDRLRSFFTRGPNRDAAAAAVPRESRAGEEQDNSPLKLFGHGVAEKDVHVGDHVYLRIKGIHGIVVQENGIPFVARPGNALVQLADFAKRGSLCRASYGCGEIVSAVTVFAGVSNVVRRAPATIVVARAKSTYVSASGADERAWCVSCMVHLPDGSRIECQGWHAVVFEENGCLMAYGLAEKEGSIVRKEPLFKFLGSRVPDLRVVQIQTNTQVAQTMHEHCRNFTAEHGEFSRLSFSNKAFVDYLVQDCIAHHHPDGTEKRLVGNPSSLEQLRAGLQTIRERAFAELQAMPVQAVELQAHVKSVIDGYFHAQILQTEVGIPISKSARLINFLVTDCQGFSDSALESILGAMSKSLRQAGLLTADRYKLYECAGLENDPSGALGIRVKGLNGGVLGITVTRGLDDKVLHALRRAPSLYKGTAFVFVLREADVAVVQAHFVHADLHRVRIGQPVHQAVSSSSAEIPVVATQGEVEKRETKGEGK